MGSKERTAAALGFDARMNGAPVVLSAGQGTLAERIIEIARSFQIPVVENAFLAKLLVDLPTGKEIPENLYRAVAAILAMVYDLERNQSGYEKGQSIRAQARHDV